MPFFAVHYHYSSDSARLDELRGTHREFLRSLLEEGSLRASGPFVGARPSALLIFTADDEQAVRDLLAKDPFQEAGLIEGAEVTEWNPVIGAFAAEL